MTLRYLAIAAALGLSACAPTIPDSNPGVGFDDYDTFAADRAARDAALAGQRPPVAPTEARIGEETLAVLAATERPPNAVTVTETAPATTAPTASAAPSALETSVIIPIPATSNNPDISDEQSFDAVSARQSIESDAERLARIEQSRQEVAPVPVPERSGSRPNIVAYALATQNQVGETLYPRSGSTSASRFQRNCARFVNANRAQEEFLAKGGPERDRGGLDPDGDGFACFWDPTPYRAARGG